MPRVAQVPTDPMLSKKKSVPTYQRRHSYFWAYEDRVFTKTTSSEKSYNQTTSNSTAPLINKHFDGMVNGEFW